jgi:hypothetical protein
MNSTLLATYRSWNVAPHDLRRRSRARLGKWGRRRPKRVENRCFLTASGGSGFCPFFDLLPVRSSIRAAFSSSHQSTQGFWVPRSFRIILEQVKRSKSKALSTTRGVQQNGHHSTGHERPTEAHRGPQHSAMAPFRAENGTEAPIQPIPSEMAR